jgi:hypothetical protein
VILTGGCGASEVILRLLPRFTIPSPRTF